MLPVGPARFRFAASPHALLLFRESSGNVTAVDFVNGGAPAETYVRQ